MTTPLRRRPHVPLRPLWLCRACGHPWPCAVARLTLTDEYAEHPSALAVYLCLHLYDATADLHRLSPGNVPSSGELFDRFLGWADPYRAPNLAGRTAPDSGGGRHER